MTVTELRSAREAPDGRAVYRLEIDYWVAGIIDDEMREVNGRALADELLWMPFTTFDVLITLFIADKLITCLNASSLPATSSLA